MTDYLDLIRTTYNKTDSNKDIDNNETNFCKNMPNNTDNVVIANVNNHDVSTTSSESLDDSVNNYVDDNLNFDFNIKKVIVKKYRLRK